MTEAYQYAYVVERCGLDGSRFDDDDDDGGRAARQNRTIHKTIIIIIHPTSIVPIRYSLES